MTNPEKIEIIIKEAKTLICIFVTIRVKAIAITPISKMPNSLANSRRFFYVYLNGLNRNK